MQFSMDRGLPSRRMLDRLRRRADARCFMMELDHVIHMQLGLLHVPQHGSQQRRHADVRDGLKMRTRYDRHTDRQRAT